MRSIVYILGMAMAFYLPDELDGVVTEQPESTPDTSVDEVMKEAKRKAFLRKMSEIESSGGKNLKHRLMDSGIHAGQRAAGQYGLMPLTMREMYKRMGKNADPRLKDIFESTQDDQELANKVAADPELEEMIANRLYEHVDSRFGGDEEKMSLAWEVGHNSKPESLSGDRLEKHPRTEKFRKLKQMVNRKPW